MSGRSHDGLRSSPIELEILSHRLTAVVEEMAENIRRTSFSTFVKQTADFGTCLVTPQGEVFAAPRRISGNTMIGIPARAAIDSLGEYRRGDVGLSNDPDATGGLVTHLPDLWTWAPLWAGDEIIAYAFSFVHSSDIGGSVPGSILWEHTDIHQEGILIPPVRLIDAGTRNEALIDLITRNTRVPEQNLGDIEAQIVGLRTAQRRLDEIVDGFGVEAVTDAIEDLLDISERRAGDMIERLTDGVHSFVDYVEGVETLGEDGQRVTEVPPVRLSLELTVSGRSAHLSFEGTSPQVLEAVNLHTGGEPGHYMLAFALVNWTYSHDHAVPYNSGLVRPLRASLPVGSVVNPQAGAPCGVRAAIFFRIMDLVVACLAQADPETAMATGAGAVSIAAISHVGEDGRRKVSVGQPLTGGSGGRPGQPGLHGTSYMGGWLRNVPNEVLESDVPVVVEAYHYRDGSGGAGEFPGGDGLVVTMRARTDGVTFAVRGLERLLYQPWGVHGGQPGATARATLNPGTDTERDLGRVGTITLRAGDVLSVETPGGGGLGVPQPGAPEFSLGPARIEDDRRWPQDMQRRLIEAVLGRIPLAQQPRVYRDLYLWLDRTAGSGTVTEQMLLDGWARIAAPQLAAPQLATPQCAARQLPGPGTEPGADA